MDDYEVRVRIGAACYSRRFVETGEYNSTWRSGCAVGAWVAQEVAKIADPTEEDVDRLSRELVAEAFRNGTVRSSARRPHEQGGRGAAPADNASGGVGRHLVDDCEVRRLIGAACYEQGFKETGERSETWRSGCVLGAWVVQEVAKIAEPTEEDVDCLSRDLMAKSYRLGAVK